MFVVVYFGVGLCICGGDCVVVGVNVGGVDVL